MQERSTIVVAKTLFAFLMCLKYSVNAGIWNSSWAGKSIDCLKTHWMHTAKTGSTFCLAMQHVCCKDQFEPLTDGIQTETLTYAFGSPRNKTLAQFHYVSHYCYKFERNGFPPINCSFTGRPEHIALHSSVNLGAEMGMVIIREPKARVISALLDGVHVEGFENRTRVYELRNMFTAMDKNKETPHLQKLIKKAELYSRHPGLYGHQVKMLLGDLKLDLSVKTDELYPSVVDKAVERLRQFYFVGIFEEYARSLKLFHALANVGTVPTPVELFRQRSTTGNDSAYLMEHLSYEDPYDTLLYQQASRIFEEELAYVKQWKGLDL